MKSLDNAMETQILSLQHPSTSYNSALSSFRQRARGSKYSKHHGGSKYRSYGSGGNSLASGKYSCSSSRSPLFQLQEEKEICEEDMTQLSIAVTEHLHISSSPEHMVDLADLQSIWASQYGTEEETASVRNSEMLLEYHAPLSQRLEKLGLVTSAPSVDPGQGSVRDRGELDSVWASLYDTDAEESTCTTPSAAVSYCERIERLRLSSKEIPAAADTKHASTIHNEDGESVWISMYTMDDGSIYTTLSDATYGQLIDVVPMKPNGAVLPITDDATRASCLRSGEEHTCSGTDTFHHGLDKDELMSMVSALTMESVFRKSLIRENSAQSQKSLGSVPFAKPNLSENSKPASVLRTSNKYTREASNSGLTHNDDATDNATDRTSKKDIKRQRALARKKKRASVDSLPRQPSIRATILESPVVEEDESEELRKESVVRVARPAPILPKRPPIPAAKPRRMFGAFVKLWQLPSRKRLAKQESEKLRTSFMTGNTDHESAYSTAGMQWLDDEESIQI